MKIYHILYALIFALVPQFLQGQSLDDAKNWYLEGRYVEALPIFRAEYENNPTDAPLNQWLGVSLYETGQLKESEKYLAFASQKNIPEAYLYLGELYAKMYRFAEAEKEFERYQRAKRRDKDALTKLDEKRDYAARLQRVVSRTENVQIIDSLVVSKTNFLSAYNVSASAGTLMPMNEFFKNRDNGNQTLYMNERKDKIYYSQGDAFLGSDLYTMEKLLDNFGNEKKLSDAINTAGSQAYPFVMTDGLTIYFASTGHNSFGGYDLFVTRYNLASDSYLTPNQLNSPFNSPFNDYLMVIDEEKGIGWFASDRFQPADSVCVYTFIPNPKVTLVESDDDNYLANRALISSISDTWEEGKDYTSLRARARQRVATRDHAQGDFTFVINDKATYRSLTDFKSAQARNLFSNAMELEKQLKQLTEELSDMRNRFAEGGSGNASLRASILDLEQRTESIYRETEKLKTQARNEEIRNTL